MNQFALWLAALSGTAIQKFEDYMDIPPIYFVLDQSKVSLHAETSLALLNWPSQPQSRLRAAMKILFLIAAWININKCIIIVGNRKFKLIGHSDMFLASNM